MTDSTRQTQIVTARTEGTAARTQLALTNRSTYEPDQRTLAARSLAALGRISEYDQRRAAFSRHLDEYPPTLLAQHRPR